MASLRVQLLSFWLLLLVVCAGLGAVMVVLYRNSAGVQVEQARLQTQQTCSAIAERYRQSLAAGSGGRDEGLMQVVLQLALVEAPHIEGGVWSGRDGFLAYAYPTYEGGGIKRDVPDAERPHIAEVAAAGARTPRTDVVHGSREALVLSACPLGDAARELAAWTMTRVPAQAEAALRHLRLGLAALLGVVLCSGLWLGAILARGYRHVQQIEAALGADAQEGADAALAATGVEELDRLVAAVNRFRARLDQVQRQAQALQRQQAHDQRLTALGRMTGGIAHEIRNPIATMRLKAENALAAPGGETAALRTILQQIERLDRLVQNLLALVQPLQLHIQTVKLDAWLDERRAPLGPRARDQGLHLHFDTALTQAPFDPVHLGRAVDNLLDNAVRHAPPAGRVSLRLLRSDAGRLRIEVADNGPGVPPELREHLFEPFASGRAEGTGLGLALVREVALAHGGDVRYVFQDGISRFELDLPWRAS
jgi:signal transduction histidine kinase